MRYEETITLKDGRRCLLRTTLPEDASAYLAYFRRAHSETEFLTTYPDESTRTIISTIELLIDTANSSTDVEISAFLEGELVGSAGNTLVSKRDKVKHRAEFGISLIRRAQGLGIGRALTQACIACARQAGLRQLELTVVEENVRAVGLYRSLGFTEYGRNPLGFITREGRVQPLLLMRLEL